jgi:hypothetical protein
MVWSWSKAGPFLAATKAPRRSNAQVRSAAASVDQRHRSVGARGVLAFASVALSLVLWGLMVWAWSALRF